MSNFVFLCIFLFCVWLLWPRDVPSHPRPISPFSLTSPFLPLVERLILKNMSGRKTFTGTKCVFPPFSFRDSNPFREFILCFSLFPWFNIKFTYCIGVTFPRRPLFGFFVDFTPDIRESDFSFSRDYDLRLVIWRKTSSIVKTLMKDCKILTRLCIYVTLLVLRSKVTTSPLTVYTFTFSRLTWGVVI